MNRALIFDCDGVLADTERDGHLPAFNATFKAMGLPVRWTPERYRELLAVGGGKERLASIFTPEFIAEAGLPVGTAVRRDLIKTLHREKTARYTTIVREGALPGRPGVARLAAQADEAGWHLAVASTSAEESVRAVLEHVMGLRLAQRFSVFAGDVVAHKKPAPDIYMLALRTLGLAPTEAIVVEDSSVGLRAALGAGLTTVITVSGYTCDEDFAGAALVLTSLGSHPDEPAEVLANPHGLDIGGELTFDRLTRLLGSATRQGATSR